MMVRGYTTPGASKPGRIVVIILVILLIGIAAFLFGGKLNPFGKKKACSLSEDTKIKAFDTMVGFYLWGVEDAWFKTRSNQEVSAMALSETAKKMGIQEEVIKQCWTTSRGSYSPKYSKNAKIKGGIQL